MMQGPWYFFHLDSPGYLQRKLDQGEPISRSELIRAFKANPGFAWEGTLYKLYCQMLDGSFKGKPGPKERLSWSMWQCINAWVDLEAEDIRTERAGRPQIGADLSPMQEAYERTARQFQLGSGSSLANSLSSRKLR
ncbi:hypothetical protein [Sphingobium olei]|uniref:Uncharacterized protein n=1 Tax=Sphingobium olei TaxID=420955 RepID=A0ABW3P380_9SPHN